MRRTAWIPLVFLLALPAFGGHEFVPVQDRAQGQSLVGANLLNDSLYSNPAASAFTQVYTVEGAYELPRSFGVSILDTKSSSFGGAFGYFRQLEEGAADPLQGLKLALMGRLSQVFGVGVAGKSLWGPNRSGGRTNLKDVDVGLLARLSPFNLGFTARNVFGGAPDIGQGQEWAFGGQFNYQQVLSLSAAVLGDWQGFKPYQYGFGAEFITPYYFSIKGGYRFRPATDQAWWSTGLSFLAPRIALHYSVEFPRGGGSTEHLLATTLLF